STDGRVLAGRGCARGDHRRGALGCVLLRPRATRGDRTARRQTRSRRAAADPSWQRHGPGRGCQSPVCQLNRKRGDTVVTADEAMVAICRCWDQLDADALAALFTCEVTLGHTLASGDLGFAEGEFRSALAGGGRLDFPFALIVEMEDGL